MDYDQLTILLGQLRKELAKDEEVSDSYKQELKKAISSLEGYIAYH